MRRLMLMLILFIGTCLSPLIWAHELQPGDIVIYRGAFTHIISNSFFEHAGIYVGKIDDSGIEYVVEFNGGTGVNSSDAPVIVKTPLDKFVKRSPNNKIEYLDFEGTFNNIKPYDSKYTVSMALEYLRNGGKDFGTYSLLTNNCQHFAMYCKSGLHQSWQANALSELILEPIRNHSETLSGIVDAGIKTVDWFSKILLSPNY